MEKKKKRPMNVFSSIGRVPLIRFCLVVDGFRVPFEDRAGTGVDGKVVLHRAVADLAFVLPADIVVVQLELVAGHASDLAEGRGRNVRVNG